MIKRIVATTLILFQSASPTVAKLPDARIVFDKAEAEIVKMLHLPTGCAAQIEIKGKRLLSASITDPDCLPRGANARKIPGTLIDFGPIRTP